MIEKEQLKDIIMEIIICINGLTKKFQVMIRLTPNLLIDNEKSEKTINKYITIEGIPLCNYNIDKNSKYNLQKINNIINNNYPKENIFVTPFEIQSNPIYNRRGVNVQFLIQTKEKNNYFDVINEEGICTKLENDDNTTGNFLVKKIDPSKISKIPLIGEYNGIWYPTINDFNSDKIKILKSLNIILKMII